MKRLVAYLMTLGLLALSAVIELATFLPATARNLEGLKSVEVASSGTSTTIAHIQDDVPRALN